MSPRRHRLALAATLLTAMFAASSYGLPEPPKESPSEEAEGCLGCHEDPSIEVAFADGTRRTLQVDRNAFAQSVHFGKVACSECHPGFQEVPHPERRFASEDEFRNGMRQACQTCHFQNYSRYMDGVHHRVAQEGGPAPSCVDCHDAHAVTPPGKPRTRVSDTCSTCHSDVAEAWARSVHGRLASGPKPDDAPVCTDCHRSHDIQDPKTQAFLLRTPETCARCHADAERMKPYGLSASVVSTYLSDFHGMTASLEAPHAEGTNRVTAVCVDCHGFHDITKVDEPGSKVMKENLLKTCQQCHPDAAGDFPSAWLSHFEPSLTRAPLVYLTKQFYTLLIPFIIGGLVLQILLHFWRVVVNR